MIPALYSHLAAAAVAAFLAWQFQGARLGAELADARLETTTQQLATSTAQRAADARVRLAEKAISTKYQGALNAARDREALLRRDRDQLLAVADGLREQSADAARRLASAAPAAVLEYATALGVVFEDCRAAYGGMAAKAAGHAADVQTLGAAWPESPSQQVTE
jgi:septal ring factor EnvC (AmiA/AmiB activator)